MAAQFGGGEDVSDGGALLIAALGNGFRVYRRLARACGRPAA
jgi:hypothetical protein